MTNTSTPFGRLKNAWPEPSKIDIPKPGLTDADRERLQLDADSKVPTEYVATMYELMHLAFMTDSTGGHLQIASMGDATTLGGKFPQLLGIGKHLHGLASWNGLKVRALGKWDRFLAEQFATFLDRMHNTPAGPDSDATLLDQTTIIYGCSSNRHEQELSARACRRTRPWLQAWTVPQVRRGHAVRQRVRHHAQTNRGHQRSPTAPDTSRTVD